MKKILLALSGGVDSSVSIYLLKKMKFIVTCIHFIYCDSIVNSIQMADYRSSILTANYFNVDLYILNITDIFNKKVIEYTINEYKNGRIPNPDIVCNFEVKFKLLLQISKYLGINYISTGHYVKKKYFYNNKRKIYKLLISKDTIKDQSYFLCRLKKEQISKSIFPLGNFNKKDVINIAKKIKLHNIYKKSSSGVCFIGEKKFNYFLKKKIPIKYGNICTINDKNNIIKSSNNNNKYLYINKNNIKTIGIHDGVYYYCIGQRKGINISGQKKPMFVIGKNLKKNELYVSSNMNKLLYNNIILVDTSTVYWIYPYDLVDINKLLVKCKFRNNQKLQSAYLYSNLDKNYYYFFFKKKQKSINPGQFIVWYKNNIMLGSAIIK